MNYAAVPLEAGEDASWDASSLANFVVGTAGFGPVLETNNAYADDVGVAISIDIVLPDDILERILSFLPVASVFRASAVCRRWHDIVRLGRFLWTAKLPQNPWYFMFTCNEDASGYAYDPILRKWYNLHLPCIKKNNWVFVCNPITSDWKRLPEPPGVRVPDYSSLMISVDRESHRYTVAVAKSKQTPNDFLSWDFSIHVYDSERGSWVMAVDEVLFGWRGGDESVVCDGVLYCLIHRTNVCRNSDHRHALIVYDLSSGSPRASLLQTLILAPCFLTCGRLMNVKDRLVIVGGIAKYDRPDIIKGISIWELHRKAWREIAKMPHRFFQGFGELDDVFASSGSDDLIFIHSYGATALLIFDMSHKQ